jgi:ribosomal-protein-alanine N-acetyltransferase
MSQIRLAQKDDLPALLAIIHPFQSPGFNWSEDNFRSEFASAETWVLTNESEILAFVCFRDAVDAWEISILATRKDVCRQGLMETLLISLIERNGSQRQFWLEVHEHNKSAQKLYEKLGFRNDGRRGGYYSDGSAALLYSLQKKPQPT